MGFSSIAPDPEQQKKSNNAPAASPVPQQPVVPGPIGGIPRYLQNVPPVVHRVPVKESSLDDEAEQSEQYAKWVESGLVREPLVGLLAAGMDSEVGTSVHEDKDAAVIEMADIAVAFAEADQLLYEEEKKTAQQKLLSLKRDIKSARANIRSARRNGNRQDVKSARDQRKQVRKDIRAAKKNIRHLGNQDEYRGHGTEWQSLLLQKEGGYNYTTPMPGAAKRNVDYAEGTFNQGSLNPPNLLELEAVGIKDMNIDAVLHSHPISGDKDQAKRRIGHGGLEPSDTDKETAKKQPFNDYLLNPRGRVTKYGGQGNVRELSQGVNIDDYPDSDNLAVERARERLTPKGFDAEVERAMEVLRSVDRQELVKMQEGKGK